MVRISIVCELVGMFVLRIPGTNQRNSEFLYDQYYFRSFGSCTAKHTSTKMATEASLRVQVVQDKAHLVKFREIKSSSGILLLDVYGVNPCLVVGR